MDDHDKSESSSPRGGNVARRRRGRATPLWRKPPLLVGLVAAAAMTLGADYVWVGGGSSNDWDDCGNWVAVSQPPCYPSTSGADALIPWNEDPWEIELNTSEEIDIVTIEGSVDFISGDDTLTFIDNGLDIDAAEGDIEVTLQGGAYLFTP
jgi:hypothetical protein